jgi:hypothetical protein
MIVLAALLLAHQVAATEPALPRDVQAFVDRYDECEHWLGEEPYDAARRREINRAIKKVCTGIDALPAKLRAAHPTNTAVDRVLFERPPLLSGTN